MADPFEHPIGMPWLTSTRLESRTETSSEPTSHFDRIPAETRNQIYELLLVEEGPVDINASGGWPGILSAWKQLGDEAASIYLRNANFTVTILDLNSNALVNWLEGFKHVPAELKTLVKSVKVVCLGDMINRDDGGYGHPIYSANFDYWHNLIDKISASGLKSHQLQWPGLVDLDLSIAKTRAGYSDARPCPLGVQKYLLNEFILTPLLAQHGILNEATPPVNILRQLGQESRQWRLDPHHVAVVARTSQHNTLGNAKAWFDSWRMSKLMVDICTVWVEGAARAYLRSLAGARTGEGRLCIAERGLSNTETPTNVKE
ncbi:hypothetical protein LTR37_013004 [Vermiconidia calcicola]|uniref:Uncharacterized protein n=1 Tax=Vermiconidia calcicola TaxID=1690605 RepID=A0ACC3MZ37_9PEZI|nr:hypothetical protein LTR37_013004 [Vermiconidia calcicola]